MQEFSLDSLYLYLLWDNKLMVYWKKFRNHFLQNNNSLDDSEKKKKEKKWVKMSKILCFFEPLRVTSI